VRDKHVAHSVNSFERCQAISITLVSTDGQVRYGGAVGVATQYQVGLTGRHVLSASEHIGEMIEHVQKRVDALRSSIHDELTQMMLDPSAELDIAGIFHIVDRSSVAQRREDRR